MPLSGTRRCQIVDQGLLGNPQLAPNFNAVDLLRAHQFISCMRDSDAIAEMDLPVYCKGITPQGPYKFGPGEINVPVCVGGQVVHPGDILVGDMDGIVVIPPEDAPEVLEKVKEKVALETETIANYIAGKVNYEKHQKLYGDKMDKDGYSYF